MNPAGAAGAPAAGDMARLAALSEKITGQIARLKGTASNTTPATESAAGPDSTTAQPPPAPQPPPAQVHGPRVTVARASSMTSSVPGSERHLADLIRRFTARTARSKELAARYRPVLADSRATVGFRDATKEMLYPLAADHARGCRLTDVDGNEYVDITMGFGTLLFGHEPEFLTEAVRGHLSRGLRLGPRSPETGEAAELLTRMTGMERAAFTTSGTEANAAAFRLARAATGRSKIVIFHGAYHGHADATLGRGVGRGPDRRTVPLSPGVPGGAMADLIVLDYGDPASLDVIAEHAHEIAAVAVEPVQSRNPSLQPVAFVRELRELTRRTGVVLLFDEMLTGLRPHPRGAQELYGVVPDLATYGKLLGGGFPVGAVAGRADLMDGVDGGQWQYGDDSHPERETTFVGGTYLQHPLAMTAATAVLRRLGEGDGAIQHGLNERTARLTDSLNRFFEDEEFPLKAVRYGSMFRFEHRADLELLYHHLVLRGVYVWEWRNFFLSTAHTDEDVAVVEAAVTDSLRELRDAGFFPRRKPAPATGAASARTPERPRPAPDMSLYFFGDYPEQESAADAYDTIAEAAHYADRRGFHALWLPERHFHAFGGVFPNPSVLAAALARETEQIRLNAGSVVLPLHDPVRVAEEWSVVDNLSRGRVGLGCASGWNARDFVFFPDRFGGHRESMYDQVADVRTLWNGGALRRRGGDGDTDVRLFPRPFQRDLPVHTAIVGNPESYRRAGEHDLGVVTNLMGQSPEQLAENIARYRRARAEHGHDPDAGRVAVLLHTYLADDHAEARETAYKPLFRYMRSSLSLFGQMTSSLGRPVDLSALSEDDLDAVFSRAYDRYCDQRALIGSPRQCLPVVDALREAGVDEVAALLDFGVPPRRLLDGLPRLDALRRAVQGEPPSPEEETRQERRRAVALTDSASPARTSSPGPEENDDGAPLSPGQRRIWILERLLPGRGVYNEPVAVPLDGALDTDALREALSGLTERHEALRTVFRTSAVGEPLQYVLPHTPPELPVVDLPGRTEAEALREALAAESARRFDLARGPLFHARVLRRAEQRHVLVLSFHHIVVDAVSASVLARDLSALYRAAQSGASADVPELPLSPREFSRRAAAATPLDEDLAYWRRTLDGAPAALDLPADRPRPPRPSGRGRVLRRSLPPELVAALRASGRGARSTLFMTLLTGYAAMLREISGEEDFVVGVPVSERPEGTRDLVGFFVNTLALRLDASGERGGPELTFRTLLDRVRGTLLDAYDHARVPFEAVVDAVAPPRADTSRTPVFQVMAEYEEGPPFALDLPDVATGPAAVGADKALVDLTVYFSVHGDDVECRYEYSTDLFDETTVAGFARCFERILRAAAADPSVRLAAPRTGSFAEGEARAVEETTLCELFARQVREGPERPAVQAADGSFGYGELDARAEQLAAVLRARTDDSAQPVAVWVPRSAELIVAMLAVLKAGRPLLPLDPALGPQRVADVLADSGARTVLTGGGAPPLPETAGVPGRPGLPGLPEGVTVLDTGTAGATARAVPDSAHSGGSSPLSHLIYTSGSEGRPKGIGLGHRGLVDLVQWQHRRFGTGPGTRTAVVCSQSFDVSLLEIWPTLTAGGCLIVADEDVRRDPRALSRWYEREGIAFTALPTALAEQLLALPPRQQPPLRHLLCGGEQLTRRPHADVPYETVNIYGPSEVTVLALAYTVPPAPPAPDDVDDGPIPLGHPIGNVRLDVLDAEGRPVPPGTVGELHISGPGVGLGYHGAPERTAERFVPTTDGVRFHSGDLVEMNAEGALVFRGRTDDQVKISGFRVEPAEPDRVLRELPGVRNAAVVARKDGERGHRLVGHVVPADGDPADADAYLAGLERQLSERLPHYMVPREWSLLQRLPLNVNGKLDRAALPPGRIPGLAPPSAPSSAPPGSGEDAAAVEATVRKLWADVLGADTGRLADDVSFFSVGGDSLGAIRLVGRAGEEFGADYPVVDFFERPTLRAMTDRLTDGPGFGPGPGSSPDDRVRGEI